MRKKYMKSIIVILLFTSLILTSCWKKQKLDEYETPVSSNPLDSLFQINKIDDHIYEGVKSIKECISSFDEDIEKVQNKEYKRLKFDNCEFVPMGEFETVAVQKLIHKDISAKDSLDVIKNVIYELGYDIDLENELRAATDEFEWDNSKEYPYYYPSVLDKLDKYKNGNSFFVNTKKFHIQMCGDGIYSYSDGCINEFMGGENEAGRDAFGEYFFGVDPVAEGTVEELGDKEWELVGGQVSVKEAARMAEDYFNNNKFYPCEEGITSSVRYVRVYPLKDRYVYYFLMNRVYKGIPFAGGECGIREYEYGFDIDEDTKGVYVINGDTVSAFIGETESQGIETVSKEYTSIISLEDAAGMVDKKLSAQLEIEVDKVEFVYLPVSLHDDDALTTYVYPCWSFDGEVNTNNKKIKIYVDVLTGYVLYYTYQI